MEEQQFRNALPQGFELFEYQIDSVLGRPGGFGITYLATDTHLRHSVAIKEYLPSDFAVREGRNTVYVRSSAYEDSFQWGLNCFIEEARVLAKFKHPSIVRVLRFFEANGTAYMVMEYQKGGSLTDYLKQRRILTEDELLSIVLPLLDGLKEIHLAGFFHRDIKPNNIYIREDKTPVLLDFGSARFAVGQRSRSVTSIVTPGYAPLEQYDNEMSDQGPWTDIYALGAVMYCTISGEAPPAATRRVMKDPIIPAVKLGKGKYNENILQSIDWALQLSEEDRPQTIEQWREKILAASPQATLTGNMPQSNCTLLNVAYMGVILLLCAVTTILWYKNRTYQNEMQAAIEKFEKADAKFVEEQKAHDLTEKKLSTERRKRKNTEDKYFRTSSLLKEIQRFEPDLIKQQELQKLHFDEKKYYDIFGVSVDDTLNIREFPGPINKIIGEISPLEKCVEYMGQFRLMKSDMWVKVQYQKVQGWVNTYYLIESSQDCNGDKNVE